MVILIEQPDLGLQGEDKRVPFDNNDLVLDGGFPVPKSMQDARFEAPEINSFGHSFRQQTVEEFYRVNHINQTYDFVTFGNAVNFNDVVDDSDPDLDEPQIEHLLQTAEAIRKDYPNEDWLHLTGLIHDLGKVLLHPSFGGLPQWAVVGDTFPLGCAFDKSIVHHKYFEHNPDSKNSVYNTENGIYVEGCGLDNVMISWGHDDYMWLRKMDQLCLQLHCSSSDTTLFII
ncbi:Inositol oxygenase 2 [Camellia lanceoleosa]|uniref:Inositol oxygenase 2 n=1 Tax=Camellia lanceoleosa TaxID=1840588 RepID=A0ACC0FFG6_9ERIC|nr:Inositol oxygenase 2 [Camellia lanceoleosa]